MSEEEPELELPDRLSETDWKALLLPSPCTLYVSHPAEPNEGVDSETRTSQRRIHTISLHKHGAGQHGQTLTASRAESASFSVGACRNDISQNPALDA